MLLCLSVVLRCLLSKHFIDEYVMFVGSGLMRWVSFSQLRNAGRTQALRQTDRQTDGRTDRRTDRQTDNTLMY